MDVGQLVRKIYEENKDKPYLGLFSFDQPALFVIDLALVKDILVKDSHAFADRILSVDESLDPLNSKIMFTLKGQKWKHVRQNLTPTFTSGKMKKMFYLVDNCAKQLVQCIDDTTFKGANALTVKPMMDRYVMDVISRCAFGLDSSSLQHEDAEFSRNMRRAFHFSSLKSFVNLTTFFAPEIQSILRVKIMDQEVESFLRDVVWGAVRFREQNDMEHHDFFAHIMKLRTKGFVRGEEDMFRFEGDNFVAQAFLFFAADFDTSTATLTFALYEMSQNPDVQQRLRMEIEDVLATHGPEVSYDAIQKMTYLEMVMSETHRKYPIVPFLDRKCVSDYTLLSPSGKEALVISRGTGIMIPVTGFHYDPEYFPDPERFDPERFSEENKKSIPRFSYLPFGDGPRSCIGMRFALMQNKAALIHILRNFQVVPCEDTPKKLKLNPKAFLMEPQGDLNLLLKKLPK
ncbi:hypothetical protein ANN_15173 [Periplaneta americana]|uniref:Cytochrome P450 n=1 Tax=Periplaneta americana TaxID=6978 RepID=A0ABQ8SGG3_PERAM|nr:hypothetical protein ANN_15173 [Periplaneta americana]